ncbi:MAG: LacI family DNA-binding transcriptional regulator [Lachnospiraceae bacterium]|nr:LacI family DNA-binding transcriptional regulator [Lachnospiraceae bacterium]
MGIESTDKVLTIHDVARELGVSASTVSRAISGKGRIGEATRKRILEYIEEHGFYPNAAAQSLAQARTNNIAVILPEVKTLVDMPFFHTCMYGVEEVAQANEYDVMVIITNGKDTKPLERLILNRKVDGMILTRTYENDCFANFLKERQMPFVTVGKISDKDIIQVDHDNTGACRELVSVLFSKGIQRIAYLGGNMEQMVNRGRYEGYQDAFKKNKRKIEQNIVYTNLTNKVLVEKAVDELLDQKVDCMLCQDDFICDEVVRKLAREGVSIPEQVRVASCHYSRILENYPVTITSLKFDIMELGRRSCQVLLDCINNKIVPDMTLLDYEISLKESTK